MKQRISALFLILAMLLCQIPQAVFASEVGASPSFFGVLISDTEGNVNVTDATVLINYLVNGNW